MFQLDKDLPTPLHHQLRKALEQAILSGRLAAGEALPGEWELCSQMGVSRTTVRRAVSDLVQQGLVVREPGRGTFVRAERKSRNTVVIAAFAVSSSVDGAPRSGSDLFFWFWDAIAAAAQKRGLQVVIRRLDEPGDVRAAFLKEIASDPATFGVVVFTWSAVDWEHVRYLHTSGFPYVLLNRFIPGREAAAVTLDDRGAAATAVRRLYELGHRRIHFLGANNPESTAHQEREAGYREAMAACGLAEWCRIEHGEHTDAGARRAVAALLRAAEPPTALITTSGQQAVGAATQAQIEGLRLPDELSIVGFEDSGRLAGSIPAITGVDYATARMGELALDVLCRQAAGDETVRCRHTVATGLIERASCAPPATQLVRPESERGRAM